MQVKWQFRHINVWRIVKPPTSTVKGHSCTYVVADGESSGVSCDEDPMFWWVRVMAAPLHLISLTVNLHSAIYLWKTYTWTRRATGGQITTTVMLIYDSGIKEMTAECAANWADMKYGPQQNDIAGQSNISKIALLFMGCLWGLKQAN